MGRHTKLMEDSMGTEAPVEQSQKSRGARWLGKIPLMLMPMLALVVAVALVGYAMTTKQISLNFAGAAPPENKCGGTPCDAYADQDRNAKERADRGTSRKNTVVVTVRMESRTASGFRGTATLVNQGAKPVKGWTLAFRMPQAKMIGASGAILLASEGAATVGAQATFRSTSVIAPGETARLVFTANGKFSAPSSCRVAGALCRVA